MAATQSQPDTDVVAGLLGLLFFVVLVWFIVSLVVYRRSLPWHWLQKSKFQPLPPCLEWRQWIGLGTGVMYVSYGFIESSVRRGSVVSEVFFGAVFLLGPVIILRGGFLWRACRDGE